MKHRIAKSWVLAASVTLALASVRAFAEEIETLQPELKPSPDDAAVEPPPADQPEPQQAPVEEPAPGLEPVPADVGPPPPKHQKKHREKTAVRNEKPEAVDKQEELVIFGGGLKYGFTSLDGSASQDKNSPTRGFNLFAFKAPSGRVSQSKPGNSADKNLFGFTPGIMIDYEEADVTATPELAKRLGGEDATLSLFDVSIMGCFLANLPVQVCPYLGVGRSGFAGKDDTLTGTVFPYGLNVVTGSPRIFKGVGMLAGAELNLYQPVYDGAGGDWSISAGSVSIYLGISY